MAARSFARHAGLLVLLALVGCEPAPVQQTRLQHFGTEIEIKLPDTSEARAREIFQRLDASLADWHRRWHAWQPSELTALNTALGKGETVRVAADLAGLLQRSQHYSERSDGLFNLAYGVAWFAGSALMGLLYDVSLVALVAVSVALQVAAIPLLLRVVRADGPRPPLARGMAA